MLTHAFRFAAALIVVLVLCSCGQKSAYQHYDACSAQTTSFAAMVACGKQNRNASCKQISPDDVGGQIADGVAGQFGLSQACSAEGNSTVAYADSLVASVRAGEMSEAEAQRRWIDFKLGRSDQHRQAAQAAAAAAAASAPRTCMRTGNVVTCN